MIENVGKERENHLVTASLLQIEPDLRIEMVRNGLFDLLVELPIDGAKFCVVTWPSRAVNTQDFSEYLASVKDNIDIIDGNPLVIAWFDEHKGLIIDTLVEWFYGEYIIKTNPCPWHLSADNIIHFFDYIRKQDSTVRILQNGEIRIVKKIILNEDRNNIQSKAELVYLRDFTPKYKMNPKPVQNYQERFYRNINGQPLNEYPHDFLDDSILKAVKTVYPNVNVFNDLLITNSDYRALLRYRNYQREYAEFSFLPDISNMPTELYPYLGRIEGARVRIEIFMLLRSSRNAFANEGFDLRFPMLGWFDTLSQIMSQLNTLHNVGDMINRV